MCLVELEGTIIEGSDKVIANRRKIIKRFDATEMLQYFARMQALSVVHLWKAPDVVLNFLMTGDNGDTAWDTARAAASAAASAAAWEAAGAAAGAAGGAAAWEAARAAAGAEFNRLVEECFE